MGVSYLQNIALKLRNWIYSSPVHLSHRLLLTWWFHRNMSVKVLVSSRGKQFKVSKQHIPGLANRMPPLTVWGLVVYCTCVPGTGGLFLGGHEPFQEWAMFYSKLARRLRAVKEKHPFPSADKKVYPGFSACSWLNGKDKKSWDKRKTKKNKIKGRNKTWKKNRKGIRNFPHML